MDYTTLRDLLAAGKWEEADKETARVMLKVALSEERGWLEEEDIENFPCDDLRTIDQLWVKYSQGRFGFSVQKRIWIECGGQPGKRYDPQVYKKFGDRIGWRVKDSWKSYNELTFNLNGSVGHLPVLDNDCDSAWGLVVFVWGCWGEFWVSFFSRVDTCKL